MPALNEERAICSVLDDIPTWVDRIVVVDNGSSDRTAELAQAGGAIVVHEPRRGYGAACQAGIALVTGHDVIVFLDADYSDHPDQMARLVDPIVAGASDLVLGSRTLGRCEDGSLSWLQQQGNALACWLVGLLWNRRYTDLGPFRAVSSQALDHLSMHDRSFGWTVEMQIKAVQKKLRILEVPIAYRQRVGKSKISGSFPGALRAGLKILWTIAYMRLARE